MALSIICIVVNHDDFKAEHPDGVEPQHSDMNDFTGRSHSDRPDAEGGDILPWVERAALRRLEILRAA